MSALDTAIAAIQDGKKYFDVVIVCTTDDHQAEYWMNLLADSVTSTVLAVSEDWGAGGAGNGLGTLYAWKKACKLALDSKNMDLAAGLREGTLSAALYHTAGKGTRLAPLPASESNNKPGVNLPFPAFLPDGSVRPLTVLEAVLRQTAIYARKGRLSVFWGDQVFLPSADFDVTPTHHVDILCSLLGDTAPTSAEWTAQGLDKYGVVAVLERSNGTLEAAQVEKVSHETATRMLAGLDGSLKQVGPSLGSFSVSGAILDALLGEFSEELNAKVAKYDTDPHFWMPLTLSLEVYQELMLQKKTPKEESMAHYNRIAKMKETFLESPEGSKLGLFGPVNVGKDACWWDYGQLKLYSKNSLLLLDQSSESAALLRRFLGLTENIVASKNAGETDVVSCLVASKLGSASKVVSSLVAGVVTPSLTADGAIVVNCAAPSIKAGKGSILYNLVSDSDIDVEAGAVHVGLVTPEGGTNEVLKSAMDIDGGKAWKETLAMNDVSFEAVHIRNKGADIGALAQARAKAFKALEEKFAL